MRTLSTATICLVVACVAAIPLNAAPAIAYYPHAGDRAADLYGRDIVGGGVVHLEDYAGKWLWVEFWSPG